MKRGLVSPGSAPRFLANSPEAMFSPLPVAFALLAVFTGGLWTTLFFRQVAAALWFALLMPLVGVVLADAIADRFTGEALRRKAASASVITAYSLGGFWLAWRLFRRAEDAQWTDRNGACIDR